jgi:hypothetical protein
MKVLFVSKYNVSRFTPLIFSLYESRPFRVIYPIFARYQRGHVNVYEEDGDILKDIKLTAITLNISFGIKF